MLPHSICHDRPCAAVYLHYGRAGAAIHRVFVCLTRFPPQCCCRLPLYPPLLPRGSTCFCLRKFNGVEDLHKNILRTIAVHVWSQFLMKRWILHCRASAILKFHNSIKSSRCIITTPGQCLLTRLQKISSFQLLHVTNRLAELHSKFTHWPEFLHTMASYSRYLCLLFGSSSFELSKT